jgi:hypothetical protein
MLFSDRIDYRDRQAADVRVLARCIVAGDAQADWPGLVRG